MKWYELMVLHNKPETENEFAEMEAGSKAKKRTECSPCVQREPLTQTSLWHWPVGSVAQLESGSASCQHSTLCLLPAGWGIPARPPLVATAASGPPAQAHAWICALAHGGWGQSGSHDFCGDRDTACTKEREKTELRVSSGKGQEVRRSGEVRTKQTSNHLWATKSMLSCQTKEALQSCLTGKPPEKNPILLPQNALQIKKKKKGQKTLHH